MHLLRNGQLSLIVKNGFFLFYKEKKLVGLTPVELDVIVLIGEAYFLCIKRKMIQIMKGKFLFTCKLTMFSLYPMSDIVLPSSVKRSASEKKHFLRRVATCN
jgi:hypothetical protein